MPDSCNSSGVLIASKPNEATCTAAFPGRLILINALEIILNNTGSIAYLLGNASIAPVSIKFSIELIMLSAEDLLIAFSFITSIISCIFASLNLPSDVSAYPSNNFKSLINIVISAFVCSKNCSLEAYKELLNNFSSSDKLFQISNRFPFFSSSSDK